MSNLKLYIAVIDTFPSYLVPCLVGHAVLRAHLAYQENPAYQAWLHGSFKKCVVSVNRREFDKIVSLPGSIVTSESSVLNDRGAVCICPTLDVPKVLKFAKLWIPK